MVDMVEARKRAKEKQASSQEKQPQAKPVARAPEPPADIPVPVSIEQVVDDQDAPEAGDEVSENFLEKLLLKPEEDSPALQTEKEAPEDFLKVLIFQLAGENYGIDIRQIREILRYAEATPVPNSVDYLEGIISFRGQMVPVLNGRKRLKHDAKTPDQKSRIIILTDGVQFHGILADSANQVASLPKTKIEPTPPVVTGIDADLIQGVCEYQEKLIILLNLERFLEY